jgi:hypothetical protein
MRTKKFVVLAAVLGLLSVPAVAGAVECVVEARSDTCDPKTEDTFTLAGLCWQSKCEGKVETPLDFVVTATSTCCKGAECGDSLQLDANANSNATITSCLTLQEAKSIEDINSIKTECNGVGGVQKIQIKAVDKYPADAKAEVSCVDDEECCGDAICAPVGCGPLTACPSVGSRCCLPDKAACTANEECCGGFCDIKSGQCSLVD